MSTALSVNVNKVALLRNARSGEVPSVVDFARAALDAGAHGITVHPRPDQRHIRITDVDALAELLSSPEYADREFNIEGNPLDLSHGDHLMPIVRRVRPTQATLVPDASDQNTSDHGFELTKPEVVGELLPIVEELRSQGCRVSLFVDPDPATAEAAKQTGADRIELYTESYAQAFGTPDQRATVTRFADTAAAAKNAGLGVNAGHDLDQANLGLFLEHVGGVEEVSIGHALVAESLFSGVESTIGSYLDLLNQR
ncbi:pyridoxine 5'-phosphate synthase [Algisphaera agarilytica]|uniref:Pyridoxine 5'-phosphate synthase n=1 Tax=Algisphaera agarilytica TaxID=1385975 RepID=A0A7X0LKG5_9BACT|nr:pyridoxine 5'-phosphate synthase [Algisphaera agarilytica]MBB6430395.1 pyridoxine 5-phosphate synthase [Algisphaera agarilytica]